MVGQGWIGAAEFWTLAPAQVWWVIEDRMPPERVSAQRDRDTMLEMLREAKRRESA